MISNFVNYFKRKKISRALIICMCKFLSLINKILPKRSTNILLYVSSRDFLNDNTEAIYNYLLRENYDKKYRIICCVPKSNDKKENNYVGYLAGIWYYLTSKYVFFSYGDFRIKPSKKQVVVNQWHGTPIKNICKLLNDGKYKNEDLDTFSLLVSSSENISPLYAKAFGCRHEKVKELGYARNDYLYSSKYTLDLLGIDKNKYSKIILWMPTFRMDKDDNTIINGKVTETFLPIMTTDESLQRLNDFLVANNILLILKIHPIAKFNKFDYSNLLLLYNEDLYIKGIKLYEFVKDVDSLITDYSSIISDYLLVDKPIGFTLDDFDDYAENRGFAIDNVKEYFPGKHIYCENDFYEYILDIKKEKDLYKEKRKEVCKFFNKYNDSNNCFRLLNYVGIAK